MIKYAVLDIETPLHGRRVYSKKKLGECCLTKLNELVKTASPDQEQLAICHKCGNSMDMHPED